jgi:lysophospholipase L1-like esterase
MRVLIAGDSAAAGVGVSTQELALCGQLVKRLSRHHAVEWHVSAIKGLDSPGLVKLLEGIPSSPFDVVILSMGANDATSLYPPRLWAQQQIQLAELIDSRFSPELLVYTAVPPMHACKALPQPLRWFMGRWALDMNARLATLLSGQDKRTMHWHPKTTIPNGLARDGIHPNSQGYSRWAEELSERILAFQMLRN